MTEPKNEWNPDAFSPRLGSLRDQDRLSARSSWWLVAIAAALVAFAIFGLKL